MYLSLPLCRILTVEEFSAIVLHELAHFKGEDAKFSIRFYPIYRGVSDSLYGVANASAQISKVGSYIPITAFKLIFIIASLFLLPPIYLLRFFLEAFSRAENHLGRERELAADALAAQIKGSKSMSSGLVKVVAFSATWNDVVQWVREAYSEGVVKLGEKQYEPRQFFSNMSHIFSALAQDSANPERLINLDAVVSPHPTDTHPPLSLRLQALSSSVAEVSLSALNVNAEPSASSLIDNVESLEVNLSDIQQRLLLGYS